MSQKTKFLKIVIPVVILLTGILIMKVLIAKRPEPKKEVPKSEGVLVQVLEARRKDTQVIIKGTGTVKAAHEISVIPQVSGRVISVSPNLVVGGFFRKDEILFEIEDTDYRLALQQAEAAKVKAEYELTTIESRALIARTEWERISKDTQTPPNPLVLFEPQLRNAKAALASASAIVERAKLDLERTKVRAPFNSRIRSEDIDIGQYVKSGSRVAILAGTDTAEIMVPLPGDDLRWLTIPRHGEKKKGSQAIVFMNSREKSYEWHGRVTRSTEEFDPKSRMMKIVIEINDPYGLKGGKDKSRPSLATGAFVDVWIKGKKLKNVFVIPRTAFRDNSSVWIMDRENKLRIKDVVPVRLEKDSVIIDKGIDDGDMIVLTNISGAADGMKLRPMK